MKISKQTLTMMMLLTCVVQVGIAGVIMTAQLIALESTESDEDKTAESESSSSVYMRSAAISSSSVSSMQSSTRSSSGGSSVSSSSFSGMHSSATSSAGEATSSSVVTTDSALTSSDAGGYAMPRKVQSSVSSAATNMFVKDPATSTAIVPLAETEKDDKIFLIPGSRPQLVNTAPVSGKKEDADTDSVASAAADPLWYPTDTSVPGCFTHDGTWTAVREDCASDQRKALDPESAPKHVQEALTAKELPTPIVIPEEETRVEVFLSETQKEKRAVFVNTALKTLVSDSENRLRALQEVVAEDSPARAVIDEKISALQEISVKVQSGDLNAADAKDIAADTKSLVVEVKTAVTQTLPEKPVQFRPLYEKFRHYIQVYPQISRELAAKGVSLSGKAATAYLDGLANLNDANLHCSDGTLKCPSMHATLDNIEKIYVEVAVALRNAKREDLQTTVDTILAQ